MAFAETKSAESSEPRGSRPPVAESHEPSPKPEESHWIVQGIDMMEVCRNIVEFHDKSKTLENKDIVLVLGTTGAGKSTLINYLMGCQMEEVTSDLGETLAEAKDYYAEIGMKLDSQTLFPEAYAPRGETLYLCDCPGFEDNRSKETAICASVAVELAIKKSRSIKGIILVIDKAAFSLQKAEGLKKIIDIMSRLLQNPEKLSSILFVISKAGKAKEEGLLKICEGLLAKCKADSTNTLQKIRSKQQLDSGSVDDDSDSLAKLTAQLNEQADSAKLLGMIVGHRDKLKIVNVFDGGESRNVIFRTLRKFTPIKNAGDELGSFRFENYDKNRAQFILAIAAIVSRAKKLMEQLNKIPDRLIMVEQLLKSARDSLRLSEEKLRILLNNKPVSDEEIHGRRTELNRQLRTSKSLLRKLENEKNESASRKTKLEEKLRSMDTAEDELYWAREETIENDSFFYSQDGATKTIEYDDIPYLKREIIVSPGGAIRQSKEIQHEGKCSLMVKRKRGEDYCSFKLNIYLERRNHPKFKQQIADLNKEIPDVVKNINVLEEEIQKQNDSIEDLNLDVQQLDKIQVHTAEEIARMRVALETEVTQKKQRIGHYTQQISTLEGELQQAKQALYEFQKLVEIVVDFVERNYLVFTSPEINAFATEYRQFMSRDLTRRTNTSQAYGFSPTFFAPEADLTRKAEARTLQGSGSETDLSSISAVLMAAPRLPPRRETPAKLVDPEEVTVEAENSEQATGATASNVELENQQLRALLLEQQRMLQRQQHELSAKQTLFQSQQQNPPSPSHPTKSASGCCAIL